MISKIRTYVRLEPTLWYLASSMFMLTFSSSLISSFVLILLRDLGATFLEVGIVASFYNLALAVSAFMGGSLCWRFGGKSIFILSLLFNLIEVLSYAGAFLAVNWLLVAFGLLFSRIAWGLRDTALISIVGWSTDKSREATVFGLLQTYNDLGAVTGPVLGGILAYYLNMSFPFFLSIPIIFTTIIIAYLKLGKEKIVSERIISSFKELRSVIAANKNVMMLILLAFLGQFFAEFGNPYRFIFMKEELHSPYYLLPLPQTALTIASLLAGIPSGYLSDRAGKRKPFIVLGSAIATIGVAFNAFAISPFMLIISSFLFGLSNVISWTCIQAYFLDVKRAQASLMSGAYLFSMWIGGILSPPISGCIVEVFGLRAPFFIELFGDFAITCLLIILFREEQVFRSSS